MTALEPAVCLPACHMRLRNVAATGQGTRQDSITMGFLFLYIKKNFGMQPKKFTSLKQRVFWRCRSTIKYIKIFVAMLGVTKVG